MYMCFFARHAHVSECAHVKFWTCVYWCMHARTLRFAQSNSVCAAHCFLQPFGQMFFRQEIWNAYNRQMEGFVVILQHDVTLSQ